MTGSSTWSTRINNDRQQDKEQKDQQWQAVGQGAEGSTMTGSTRITKTGSSTKIRRINSSTVRGSRTRGRGINNVIQQDNEQGGGLEDCNKTKQAVTISEEPIHTHASNLPPGNTVHQNKASCLQRSSSVIKPPIPS
jgi:hypothetical protein